MDTLSIVYIIIFSAFFLYGIYQIVSGTDHAQPPSTGEGGGPPVGGGGDERDEENLDGDPPEQEPIENPIEEYPEEFPVEALDLPTRAQNALLDAGVKTVSDLSQYENYTEISGVGEGYAEEIDRAIVRVKTD